MCQRSASWWRVTSDSRPVDRWRPAVGREVLLVLATSVAAPAPLVSLYQCKLRRREMARMFPIIAAATMTSMCDDISDVDDSGDEMADTAVAETGADVSNQGRRTIRHGPGNTGAARVRVRAQ